MAAATLLRKLLLGSAEKLQKDPLLDVLVLINGRGDGSGQSLVDARLLGKSYEEVEAFLREIQASAKEQNISERSRNGKKNVLKNK